MRILVDADSLKERLREIIAAAARRHGIEAVFVANRPIRVPRTAGVTAIVVEDADDWIVASARAGDLGVTRDVPLAARLVPLGVEVITDRGEHYTSENIAARLSERDLATGFREAGILRQRGRPYGAREITAFANLLDRELTARSADRAEG